MNNVLIFFIILLLLLLVFGVYRLINVKSNGKEKEEINSIEESDNNIVLSNVNVVNSNEIYDEENMQLEIVDDNEIQQNYSEDEIERLINEFAYSEINYEESDFDINDKDPLFEEAARLIVQNQVGSTSLIQRRMKLGYNRAGRLMDQLEAAGIVGPNLGSKDREVRIKTEAELNEFLAMVGDDSFEDDSSKHKGYKIISDFKIKYREQIEKRKQEIIAEREFEARQKEKETIRNELLEKQRKKSLHKEVLKELIDEGKIFNSYLNKEGKREPIPQDVMDAVWNRDGGRCVKCGSQ
jgi:DNA segregation ATPase FtsK/SpoIIIE and related proteins